MNAKDSVRILVAATILTAVGAATAGEPSSAVVEGQQVLASVNDEPITLDDLLRHIDTFHEAVTEPHAKVRAPDPSAVLERIINARLILQEARNIGLDELPEVVAKLKEGRMDLIRTTLVEHRLENVTEGDPAEVERRYRNAVSQVNIESVLFETEQAASEFEASVKAGADFGELAEDMIAQGTAKAVEPAAYVGAGALHPEVSGVVLDLEPGSLSPPIRVPEGFTIVRLLDVRAPDNAEARAKAEKQALEMRQQVALVEYTDELRNCCAEINDELVDSLDYHAEQPGLDALRKDDRVVAEIEGGEPITVRELTERIEKRFFHGMDDAIKNNRVNEQVLAVLDLVILERAAVMEVERLGIDRTPAYRNALNSLEENVLFRTFVGKVIDPEIELREDELKAWYDEHLAEYTSAERVRLDILAFHRREDAEASLAKLRAGADVAWMRSHADGQMDPDSDDPVMALQGKSLPVTALPEGVRAAVAGASRGDIRFHEQPGGPYHVVLVKEVIAPQTLDYGQVREQIANQLFVRKRQDLIDDWTTELRKASDIEILVEGGELKSLVGLSTREDT